MSTTNVTVADRDCCTAGEKPSQFERYRGFLLSRNTILTFLGAFILLIGIIVWAFGAHEAAEYIFLISALIGGIPLFLLAAHGIIVKHDITSGVMAATAMIAAIIVGEYFAAALVVFMMSVGEWLEDLTVARGNNALRDLARLVPTMVTVRRDGQEETIPVEEVALGDMVLVRSGERVGVDGRVATGTGSINQAAITGESMPVEKAKGDDVFAGTLLELGALEVQVTKLGEDTTLGQVIKMVEEAQASQAPVERVANQYARILVPFTFGVAALAYVLSGDPMRAVTVLVVVCPCALVLATPTAVAAAIANAAKHGILVKSGEGIEQVGRVDVVAFDKTGTLTYGKPVVENVVTLNGLAPNQILGLSAAAERFSEHPIGRSIVQSAEEQSISLSEPQDFEVLPGYGVTAQVDGHEVIVGNRALLANHKIDWSDETNTQVMDLEARGSTVIPVAVDNELAGLVALADAPREEAKAAIDQIRALGIKQVVMITGDNPRTAKMVAEEVGVDRHYAEVLPQDKMQIIRDLQAEGFKVAFAGDGVNDAPALAAADIGIAMGIAGTDVALETADIGLMEDNIQRIPELISLSRKTLKVIRQNVIFSMSMNMLSLVLGFTGIIGPVIGAVMHEVGALPVVANSVRLVDNRFLASDGVTSDKEE